MYRRILTVLLFFLSFTVKIRSILVMILKWDCYDFGCSKNKCLALYVYTYMHIYMHTYAIYIHLHVLIRCASSLPTKRILSITPQIHRGNVETRFCLREGILISFSFDAHMTVHITSLTFLSLYPGNMVGKKDLLFNVPAVKCQVHSNLM